MRQVATDGGEIAARVCAHSQTATGSRRGGMIDLIEQWNNNTHIGVCVLSVFLLSVFMLYLYMWGEIGGEIGGASVRTLADGDRIAAQRSR